MESIEKLNELLKAEIPNRATKKKVKHRIWNNGVPGPWTGGMKDDKSRRKNFGGGSNSVPGGQYGRMSGKTSGPHINNPFGMKDDKDGEKEYDEFKKYMKSSKGKRLYQRYCQENKR